MKELNLNEIKDVSGGTCKCLCKDKETGVFHGGTKQDKNSCIDACVARDAIYWSCD